MEANNKMVEIPLTEKNLKEWEKKYSGSTCPCGRSLKHPGFCSVECHNKYYDKLEESKPTNEEREIMRRMKTDGYD